MTNTNDNSRSAHTVDDAQVGSRRIDFAEACRALGDPVRWSIISQAAKVDELAGSALTNTLGVSKPTISYHTKLLVQAGLLSVTKRGRNHYYVLQRDALHAVITALWELVPEPLPVREGATVFRRAAAKGATSARSRRPLAVSSDEVVLLTW